MKIHKRKVILSAFFIVGFLVGLSYRVLASEDVVDQKNMDLSARANARDVQLGYMQELGGQVRVLIATPFEIGSLQKHISKQNDNRIYILPSADIQSQWKKKNLKILISVGSLGDRRNEASIEKTPSAIKLKSFLEDVTKEVQVRSDLKFDIVLIKGGGSDTGDDIKFDMADIIFEFNPGEEVGFRPRTVNPIKVFWVKNISLAGKFFGFNKINDTQDIDKSWCALKIIDELSVRTCLFRSLGLVKYISDAATSNGVELLDSMYSNK